VTKVREEVKIQEVENNVVHSQLSFSFYGLSQARHTLVA